MRHGIRKEYLDGTRRHGKYRFPIEKFLQSRLGYLWDDVHSEMSKEFDRRTYAGHTFWRRLKWTVETKCWIGAETGDVYSACRHYRAARVDGFYVHPDTGILMHQAYKRKPKPELPTIRIVINDRRAIEKIEGIWYYTEYQPNPYYTRYFAYELDRQPYSVYLKRQLNKKTLKCLNLVNDTPEERRNTDYPSQGY